MKYTIVTLIKDDAERFQQEILYSIANKLGIKGAIEKKPPAHIRLKYSFITENIVTVDNAIEEFAKNHYKSIYRLYGFGSFERDIIFIDVVPSEEMKQTYAKFIKHLKEKLDIHFKPFDGNTHFHSTLAHTDIGDKYDAIMSFLSDHKPDYQLSFDNISILKIVDGVWNVHKTYNLR